MAIKKSELYSSLWKSCDELRGGMDASQYKDYVLVLLFIKYISDKYAGVPYAPIVVPEGASFQDMVNLKGNSEIGDKINKNIIAKIAERNNLTGTIDVADFNSEEKLGSGKEMVERLTKLIAIFEKLDFSKNRVEGDDILGDAYEYLMRHFATESGKSKGQFYTPAEVSRVLAKIIGIKTRTAPSTTVYDPTCGSGSLLLKVADEAEKSISLYGQEKDVATAALARMNMVLHNHPSSIQEIKQSNTLSNPLHLDDNSRLKIFDFVVANPPFSFKSWSNGVDKADDEHGRFMDFGIPPDKNGDYAFLLHIIRSLKSRGKGAVILPHGVLFRGNAEAEIRTKIIRKGYIKGIVGLPANLFYGTPIPACIVMLDKENGENRKGIFMIDASKGFIKDGNKNRLREQDIHKIVDVFNKQLEVEKYSRMVPVTEIEKNGFNLNIPRYIDSQEAEDIHDIEAHLQGGIPSTDIDALHQYWDVYPSMRNILFSAGSRPNYSKLLVAHDAVKSAIFSHPEFESYSKKVNTVFEDWKNKNTSKLSNIDSNTKPKKFIYELSEDLLQAFSNVHLIDKYDVYQHLLVYWSETMQDDVYSIVTDGWKTEKEVNRIYKESNSKKGKTVKKEVLGIEGLEGRLISPQLIISTYFKKEDGNIDKLEGERESVHSKIEELEEEHSGEEGLMADAKNDKDKITKASVQKRLKEIRGDIDVAGERKILQEYLELLKQCANVGKEIKTVLAALEKKVLAKYDSLTETEIKTLVIENKWMAALEGDVKTEMERISQRLTGRIKELAERYNTPLPSLTSEVEELEKKVHAHLEKMGFAWN